MATKKFNGKEYKYAGVAEGRMVNRFRDELKARHKQVRSTPAETVNGKKSGARYFWVRG